MKISCTFCGGSGYTLARSGFGEDQEPVACIECVKGQMDIEIPTPDLISELMKRHDCGVCANKSDNGCHMCIFNGNFNNFKPSSTAKVKASGTE